HEGAFRGTAERGSSLVAPAAANSTRTRPGREDGRVLVAHASDGQCLSLGSVVGGSMTDGPEDSTSPASASYAQTVWIFAARPAFTGGSPDFDDRQPQRRRRVLGHHRVTGSHRFDPGVALLRGRARVGLALV